MIPALPRLASLLAATAVLAGCGPDPVTAPQPKAEAPVPVASRVLVLAGDTMVIDGKHIHLANIVAPQGIPEARCWGESLSAKHAVQLVKRLLQDAHKIEVQPTGQIDSHGRTLALVSLDGLDLGQTLYDNGAAAMPSNGRFRWCEAISREVDGGPRWSSLMEPGRN